MLFKNENYFTNLVTSMKTKVEIITLNSDKNIGDNANAEGIESAIVRFYQSRSLECEISEPVLIINHSTPAGELDPEALEELQKRLSSSKDNYYIVIGPGSHGLKAFEQLNKTPNCIFISSAHQPSERLKNACDKLDMIVLPKSAVNLDDPFFQQIKDKLILTKGVPHNTTKESLKDEYSKIKPKMDEFLQGASARLVIIGGDAPDQEGKFWLHTPENAAEFANYLVASRQKGEKFIITNGPRTGQKDPSTRKDVPDIHIIDAEMDEVTKAFRNVLLEAGLIEDQDFLLSDFRRNSPNNIKSDALFGMALEKGFDIYVAGESTTMVSVACDTLPNKNNIVLYYVDSMNPHHEANLEQFYRAGDASKLTKEFELLPPVQKVEEYKYESAATKAAVKILSCLEHKIAQSKSIGM